MLLRSSPLDVLTTSSVSVTGEPLSLAVSAVSPLASSRPAIPSYQVLALVDRVQRSGSDERPITDTEPSAVVVSKYQSIQKPNWPASCDSSVWSKVA